MEGGDDATKEIIEKPDSKISEIISVAFGEGPIGLSIKRREGIVVVMGVSEQAEQDGRVHPKDIVWKVGDLKLEGEPIDDTTWNDVLMILQSKERPLEVSFAGGLSKKKLRNSKLKRLQSKLVSESEMIETLDSEISKIRAEQTSPTKPGEAITSELSELASPKKDEASTTSDVKAAVERQSNAYTPKKLTRHLSMKNQSENSGKPPSPMKKSTSFFGGWGKKDRSLKSLAPHKELALKTKKKKQESEGKSSEVGTPNIVDAKLSFPKVETAAKSAATTKTSSPPPSNDHSLPPLSPAPVSSDESKTIGSESRAHSTARNLPNSRPSDNAVAQGENKAAEETSKSSKSTPQTPHTPSNEDRNRKSAFKMWLQQQNEMRQNGQPAVPNPEAVEAWKALQAEILKEHLLSEERRQQSEAVRNLEVVQVPLRRVELSIMDQ